MPGRRWRPRRVVGAAALLGALAGLAAIYVKGPGEGNADAALCPLSVEKASTLDPLARGEVAAFLKVERPVSLADLAFKNDAGADVTLADFAGQTVLLNLWATWCVPCREEMPTLDALEKAEGDAFFKVVALNIDNRAAARPREFLDQIGVMALDFHSDPTTGVFDQLKRRGLASGLPTTLLVDGKGCLLGSMAGPAEWNSDDARALIRAAKS